MSIGLGLGGFPANVAFPLTVPANRNEEQSSKANTNTNREDLRMKGVSPRHGSSFNSPPPNIKEDSPGRNQQLRVIPVSSCPVRLPQ
jgi:hypothetical protein